VAEAMTMAEPVAAPEPQLAWDMVKRGLPVAPLLLLAGFLGWGTHGALSAGYGVVLVLVNLVLSATSLAWAARISPMAIMATALGGFLARMLLVVLALAAVKDMAWVESVPLGLTVVVTHLGLLVWESRHVSASLAYPALKPTRTGD
jgi:hypothetical protein